MKIYQIHLKRLSELIHLLYVKNKSRLVIVDKIDRSLHPNLTKKFLELFYLINKDNNLQLLATTHDTSLLDLDLLRQDEIWFIERNNDNSSNIYSLNKFKEISNKNIEKEYLIGRYGAVPTFVEKSKIC